MPRFGAWFQIISAKLTPVYTFIDVVCLAFWILENFKYMFKCLKEIKESQNSFRDQRIQLFHFLDGKTEAKRGDTACPRLQLANDRGLTQTKLGLSFQAPQTQSSSCVPGSPRKWHSLKKPPPLSFLLLSISQCSVMRRSILIESRENNPGFFFFRREAPIISPTSMCGNRDTCDYSSREHRSHSFLVILQQVLVEANDTQYFLAASSWPFQWNCGSELPRPR